MNIENISNSDHFVLENNLRSLAFKWKDFKISSESLQEIHVRVWVVFPGEKSEKRQTYT